MHRCAVGRRVLTLAAGRTKRSSVPRLTKYVTVHLVFIAAFTLYLKVEVKKGRKCLDRHAHYNITVPMDVRMYCRKVSRWCEYAAVVFLSPAHVLNLITAQKAKPGVSSVSFWASPFAPACPRMQIPHSLSLLDASPIYLLLLSPGWRRRCNLEEDARLADTDRAIERSSEAVANQTEMGRSN